MNTEIKEAYKVIQKAWVELYNVEVGDTVRVLRKAKTNELGWHNSWSYYDDKMSESVGNLLKVSYVGRDISLDNGYGYPFFCLEPVKKAEPKIEITVKVNGKESKLSAISKETLLNIRRQS